MIQLLPHKDLYAIKVPLGAKDYYLDDIDEDTSELQFVCGGLEHGRGIPKGNYQILGEVTKDSISFDAHEYVDSELKSVGYIYMDYLQPENEKRPYKFDYPESSIRSLLELNNIYFVNPKGERPLFAMLSNSKEYIERCREKSDEWQQYEDNLVEKVLIIQKL